MEDYTSDNAGMSGNLKCLSAGLDFKHSDLRHITRRYVCKNRDKDFSECEEYKDGKDFSEIFYCGDNVVSNIVYAMKNGEGGDQSLRVLLQSGHIGHFDWWIFPWQYESHKNKYKLSYDPKIRKRQYQYLLNQQIIVGEKLAKSLQEAVEKLLKTDNLLSAHHMRKWKVLISIYQYWQAANNDEDTISLEGTLHLIINKFLGVAPEWTSTPEYEALSTEVNTRHIPHSPFNTFKSVLHKIRELLLVEVSLPYTFLQDRREQVIDERVIQVIEEQRRLGTGEITPDMYNDSILLLDTENLLFTKTEHTKFIDKFSVSVTEYGPRKKSIKYYLTNNISSITDDEIVSVKTHGQRGWDNNIDEFLWWFEGTFSNWWYPIGTWEVRFANNNYDHFRVYQNLVLLYLRGRLYDKSYNWKPAV
jgi:hypothetical protein